METLTYMYIRLAQLVSKDQVNIPKTEFKGGADGTFVSVMNVFLGICGAIAVLMIAIGGIKYIMSMGEAGATKRAKDTILYAFIGLFVVLLAGAIVNFVIGKIT
jgi:hypothetical protein